MSNLCKNCSQPEGEHSGPSKLCPEPFALGQGSTFEASSYKPLREPKPPYELEMVTLGTFLGLAEFAAQLHIVKAIPPNPRACTLEHLMLRFIEIARDYRQATGPLMQFGRGRKTK